MGAIGILAGTLPLATFSACGGESQAPEGGGGGGDDDSSNGNDDKSGTGDGFPEGSQADDTGSDDTQTVASVDGGGTSDGGIAWPTCTQKPAAATLRSFPQIYADADGPTPKFTWIEGALVTAISGGACKVGQACQIYVQDAPAYATFAAAAKHGLKVFVSGSASKYFASVVVGDRIALAAHALRYTLTGQNEILLEVNAQLPGCARTTSTSVPQPVDATLQDLTVDAYEKTHGPILVRLVSVGGKAQAPTETFGLFSLQKDGGAPNNGADGGSPTLVSISPYFLSNHAFTGLTASTFVRFQGVTGVFGLFVVQGGSKYVQVQPRTAADYPLQ